MLASIETVPLVSAFAVSGQMRTPNVSCVEAFGLKEPINSMDFLKDALSDLNRPGNYAASLLATSSGNEPLISS